ncbi:Alanine--tRNA ligase [Candidatus Hepatincolaceae symbiont of Richtersius coronifer]
MVLSTCDINMITYQLRHKFLNYFIKNGHTLLPSSSLIPHNDDTLLFTNSGMVQFKNIFTGLEKPLCSTVTTAQKCLRAGGKHNDLDNVGYTARHHTFFEMLGNFSFGDYFKEQAILYAWEFITKELGLPKEKLVATVYHEDNESWNLWKKISGLADDKIIKIYTADNFWSMGDLGPCGPCTEIFYDHGDKIPGDFPGTAEQDGERFVEIWNLVFMQYEKLKDGSMINLKKSCVDTGMGLERTAAIMQGVQDNYDTDIFKNIIQAEEEILKVKMTSKNKAGFKVIADHLRASSFMILDGILPSNEGRGYVLRRILRRAVRYAHLLGANEPIIYQLFPVLKNQMGKEYKDLVVKEKFIIDTLQQEEVKFYETFETGIKILNEEIGKLKSGEIFPGKMAFKLYDTFGFSVDLTQDVLKSHHIELDKQEFEVAFAHHRNLAKKSWQGSGENKEDPIWFELSEELPATSFVGYQRLKQQAKILSLLVPKKDNFLQKVNSLQTGEEGYLIVDQTPFYAEMGGQVGDKGYFFWEVEGSNSTSSKLLIKVLDTIKKQGDLFVHKVRVIEGEVTLDSEVIAEVNSPLRRSIARHHTGVHLLYSALRKILGGYINQQGSLVNEQKLRFDISHNKPLSSQEVTLIEENINEAILSNLPVVIESMDFDVAISKGVFMLAGEKYPKIARTVKIGDEKSNLYDFELCGGTHVSATGELGLFKIISEGSIASGVRRIEAVCGLKALEYFNEIEQRIRSAAKLLGSDYKNLEEKIPNLLEENRKIKKDAEALSMKYYLSLLNNSEKKIGRLNYISGVLTDLDAKGLRNLATIVVNKSNTCALLFAPNSKEAIEKVAFILILSKDLEKELDITILGQKVLAELDATGGGSKGLLQGVGNLRNVEQTKQALEDLLSSLN